MYAELANGEDFDDAETPKGTEEAADGQKEKNLNFDHDSTDDSLIRGFNIELR